MSWHIFAKWWKFCFAKKKKIVRNKNVTSLWNCEEKLKSEKKYLDIVARKRLKKEKRQKKQKKRKRKFNSPITTPGHWRQVLHVTVDWRDQKKKNLKMVKNREWNQTNWPKWTKIQKKQWDRERQGEKNPAWYNKISNRKSTNKGWHKGRKIEIEIEEKKTNIVGDRCKIMSAIFVSVRSSFFSVALKITTKSVVKTSKQIITTLKWLL
jgi:hypothetical protein